jgi:hypothetical protein
MADLTDDSRGTGLARWRVPPLSPGTDLIAAFQSHPLFAQAARRLSQNMVALAASNRGFDGIAKDLGRYLTTVIAVYLDATGGITLPRLKAVCARVGIASPGRARAILLYLRFLRYVVPSPSEDRVARYDATSQLRETWHLIISLSLDAARIVEPAVAEISVRLADPGYMRDLMEIHCDGMLYGASARSPETAFFRVFLSRNGGMQLLHHLMLAADEDDDYPPRKVIPVPPVSELARRIKVSRAHIVRMFNEAEAEGLIERRADGMVLLEQARTEIALTLAVRLTQTLFCAARVEAERAERRAPKPVRLHDEIRLPA